MCDVEDDKPFVCSAFGCAMRFTNEDHLNVHMKKHEMSLALNPGGHSGSPGLNILDQTPTPTKFLKNCEEIGLFQELSKNPFEEAFKKASDAEPGIPLPGPQSNELNTPVPPPLTDKPVSFLLHGDVHHRTMQSPTSSSPSAVISLQKDGLVLSKVGGFALDLSGQRSKEKISMQASSTTGEAEEEEEKVSVISIADSTQSPSKTAAPSAIPVAVSSQDIVVTQAVSSTLVGSKPLSGAHQVIVSPPVTGEVLGQHALTTTTTTPTRTAQPAGGQQLKASSPSSQGLQSCTMQVYLQLPTGQTVPVQIPATISTVLPDSQQQPQQQQQSAQQLGSSSSSLSVQSQQQPTKLAVRHIVNTPPPATTTATNSTMALKQRLKQTLQAQQQQQQQQHQQQLGVVSSSVKTEPGLSATTAQSQMSSLMMSLEGSDMDMDMLMDMSYSDLEPQNKRSKNGSGDPEDPDERRRKFLERNRAAAARCRHKRKQWINNLEKKAEELQQTNTRLQSEVSLLRGEVAQLKTLLLAHQDCPVTLQQKSQGQLALHTISMVESSGGVPFDVSQLVAAGGQPTTLTIDGHDITTIVTDGNALNLPSLDDTGTK